MAFLHLFNPENDLALAANVANYTPPRAAVRLSTAGATLPLWYGDVGDMLLCYGVPARWYDGVCEAFGIGVGLYPHSASGLALKPSPWGWSLSARKAFVDDGLSPASLPTDEQLDVMRNLSHRRTSLMLAADLADAGIKGIAAAGAEITDAGRLASMLSGAQPLMLKMPWSSSGRGVVDTRLVGEDRAMKFGLDCIRRQGSVMAEPAYDRELDFAKLFECRDGKCVALGTSVFVTDSRGAYVGNLLADESERRRRVGEKTDIALLDIVTEALRQSIERRIAPHYSGVLGVDMLADRNGVLDPCVEVNLRRTMGYVANSIADRYMAQGCAGIFMVEPKKAGDMRQRPAAVIEGCRLQAGALSLVPENPYFSIFAQIGDEGIKA